VEPESVQFVRQKGINNYIIASPVAVNIISGTNRHQAVDGYRFGIKCEVYIHPQDVSFHAITIGEDGGQDKVPAIRTKSQKMIPPYAHIKWVGNIPMHAEKPGNHVVKSIADVDEAYFSEPYKTLLQKPIGAGKFTWNIPWFFSYGRRDEVEIETVTQEADLDGSIITVRKKDQEGKFQYIDPIGIIPNEN
jgi:hypothetical protein